jgi:quercetin dioxygenase-like cupin family protein
MSQSWYAGNAADDGVGNGGWILGHFMDPVASPALVCDVVEIKWGFHPAGQTRSEWTENDGRTAASFLISGRFHLELTVGTVTLCRQGDYVVWGPGTDHSWWAEEDSVILTVRWPSKAQ